MTHQPVGSPGSSMLWLHIPTTNRDAQRRSRAFLGMDPPSHGEWELKKKIQHCLDIGSLWFSQAQLGLQDGLHFREHLHQMPYTTLCVKEAQRLYPTVPSVGRKLNTPVTFPDGRSLPKGMSDYFE